MSGSKKSLGAEIIEGLQQAVAHQRGELADTRVRRVSLTARTASASPADQFDGGRVAAVRQRLKMSQPVFAQALNVSADTVKAWEQGKRAPEGAALRLLEVAEEHPTWVLDKVDASLKPVSKTSRSSSRKR